MESFFSGTSALLVIGGGGSETTLPPVEAVVLAGSFNPLHHGHERLLAVAVDMTGRKGLYELSVSNVDKPPLERDEVQRRVAQFRGKGDLALTRAPTFVEKAAIMPGSIFVIGYDTAARLFVEKYYVGRGSAAKADTAGPAVAKAVASLLRDGASFLVAGRVGADGRYRTLADLSFPAEYRSMLREIPATAFRADISSTAIRSRRS